MPVNPRTLIRRHHHRSRLRYSGSPCWTTSRYAISASVGTKTPARISKYCGLDPTDGTLQQCFTCGAHIAVQTRAAEAFDARVRKKDINIVIMN
ncbi:hypothetical protein BDW62DRAFT_15130 [Aspergillus aurantiobrunneus]